MQSINLAGGSDKEFSEGRGLLKKLLAVIITIVVILLIIAGFRLIYRNLYEDKSNPTKIKQTNFGQNGDKVMTESEDIKEPKYFELRPYTESGGKYIVSLSDGKHFLRTKILAEIDDGENGVAEYLAARRPILDEIIIEQLVKLDMNLANDPDTFKQLKVDLAEKLNSVFSAEFLKNYTGKDKPISKVFITEFAVN